MMMRMLRTGLLIAILALASAACGQEDAAQQSTSEPGSTTDQSAGAGGEGATDSSPEPTESGSESPDLAVGLTALGEILVDGEGMTLYLFTSDPPGESVCTGGCLAAWPPLLVSGDPLVGEGVDPALVGTITRDDGTTQVTYADAPLYTWASDQQAGDVTGQGVQGVWFVVSPDGDAVENDAGTAEESSGGGSDPGY